MFPDNICPVWEYKAEEIKIKTYHLETYIYNIIVVMR